jgi:hypothetical protein
MMRYLDTVETAIIEAMLRKPAPPQYEWMPFGAQWLALQHEESNTKGA